MLCARRHPFLFKLWFAVLARCPLQYWTYIVRKADTSRDIHDLSDTGVPLVLRLSWLPISIIMGRCGQRRKQRLVEHLNRLNRRWRDKGLRWFEYHTPVVEYPHSRKDSLDSTLFVRVPKLPKRFFERNVQKQAVHQGNVHCPLTTSSTK